MKSNLKVTKNSEVNVPKKKISGITRSKGFKLSLFRYPEDASPTEEDDPQTKNENKKTPNKRGNRQGNIK